MEATTAMAALSAVSRKELAEAEAAEAAARATLRAAEAAHTKAIAEMREAEAAYLDSSCEPDDSSASPPLGVARGLAERLAIEAAHAVRHARARHEAANERLAELRYGLGLPHPSPAGGGGIMPPSRFSYSYSRRHPCPACLEPYRRGCECVRNSEHDARAEEARYR